MIYKFYLLSILLFFNIVNIVTTGKEEKEGKEKLNQCNRSLQLHRGGCLVWEGILRENLLL